MTRRALTPKAKAELWRRQNGGCASCRAPLVLAHADHKNPLWCTGDNAADNWQLLCIPCHNAKTRREAAARAKTKRLEGERLNGRKAAKAKIQSRAFGPSPGFDKRQRRRMDGRVEART